MGGEGFSLFLHLGENKNSFDLEKAVCNHGCFMMAPNNWIPFSKILQRPLRLADSTKSVNVSILKPCISTHRDTLLVRVHDISPCNVSRKDEVVLLQQVRRMLRISLKDEQDVQHYHQKLISLEDNDNAGFGRIFRTPTLFEDLVKCLLLCNCKWSNSLKMARALCELQFVLSSNANSNSGGKRKIGESNILNNNNEGKRIIGNFPSSKELATLDLESFKTLTNNILGYRAKNILRLAKDAESGKIRLDEFDIAMNNNKLEHEREHDDELYKKLMQINGFGSFASANALMCIGYYHKVPVDSETIRHLQEVHGRKHCDKKTVMKDVEEIYDKYAPFQCLAYWAELLDSYECKFGKLSELPASSYHTISGRLQSFDS